MSCDAKLTFDFDFNRKSRDTFRATNVKKNY